MFIGLQNPPMMTILKVFMEIFSLAAATPKLSIFMLHYGINSKLTSTASCIYVKSTGFCTQINLVFIHFQTYNYIDQKDFVDFVSNIVQTTL